MDSRYLSNILGIGPFGFVEWSSDHTDMRSFFDGEPGNIHIVETLVNFENIELESIEPILGWSLELLNRVASPDGKPALINE